MLKLRALKRPQRPPERGSGLLCCQPSPSAQPPSQQLTTAHSYLQTAAGLARRSMKLTLKYRWRPRPFRSFLGFMDLKTGQHIHLALVWALTHRVLGVTIALLFALLNKVAGVYGLIAVFTGGSLAQLSLYVYSIATLVAFAWGLRAITAVRATPASSRLRLTGSVLCRRTRNAPCTSRTSSSSTTSSAPPGQSSSASSGGSTTRTTASARRTRRPSRTSWPSPATSPSRSPTTSAPRPRCASGTRRRASP